MNIRKNWLLSAITVLSLSLTVGCASLLMLPDELSEQHYRTQAGDITQQVKTKQNQTSPGTKVIASGSKEIGILPVVYVYDTTNTLKKDEEAYYTSVFNNSSGSWMRPFAVAASNAIKDELKARGFSPFIYANSDLKHFGMKDVNTVLSSEIIGTQFKAVAYNGDSAETNYAMTDVTKFRTAMVNNIQGVAFMKIRADWEPTSANRLNSDIVLNTTLKLGYEITLCGSNSGCTTVTVPFDKGIGSNVFMPIRNSIDDSGRDKNYTLLLELHGQQLGQIVKLAFEKMDAAGTFKE